jgi:urea transport system ATP-binding protein
MGGKLTDQILVVQDVTVSFDKFVVLNHLNFSINYGELRFLIGPNGAGKTTLLDIITGKTRPTSGTVIFDETINTTRLQEHKLVRCGIARKFQTPSIFGGLTIYQNLEVAVGFNIPHLQLITKLSAIHHEKLEWVLETIGLQNLRHTKADILSHGQKQWLEIGMLLLQDPKLMLLDEPVAGMSRAERDRTGELLEAISKDRAILVVEHDMVFVRQFATTVTVLHNGQVLREGHVAAIQNDPEVIAVYLGRGHEEKTA